MMVQKNVKVLMNLYKIMEEFYGKENFITAMFIYIKYGLRTFNKEIDSKKLKQIDKELQNQNTLFDRDLAHRIDKILNEEK